MGADVEAKQCVRAHKVRRRAEDLRIANRLVAQHDMLVLAAEQPVAGAATQELDALVLRPLGGVVGELDAEAHHIDLEQQAEIAGDDVDELLEALGLEQLDHRLVDALLGREIVAGVGEDVVLIGVSERTNEAGKASSVHFVHFPFTAEQINAFKQTNAQVLIGFDHPEYSHMAVMPEAVRAALAEDFD